MQDLLTRLRQKGMAQRLCSVLLMSCVEAWMSKWKSLSPKLLKELDRLSQQDVAVDDDLWGQRFHVSLGTVLLSTAPATSTHLYSCTRDPTYRPFGTAALECGDVSAPGPVWLLCRRRRKLVIWFGLVIGGYGTLCVPTKQKWPSIWGKILPELAPWLPLSAEHLEKWLEDMDGFPSCQAAYCS